MCDSLLSCSVELYSTKEAWMDSAMMYPGFLDSTDRQLRSSHSTHAV